MPVALRCLRASSTDAASHASAAALRGSTVFSFPDRTRAKQHQPIDFRRLPRDLCGIIKAG